MLRLLTILCLFIHLASLAATQTAYGTSFSQLRWYSLFALTIAGAGLWLATVQKRGFQRVEQAGLAYIVLWMVTIVSSEYPLFSGYRFAAHVMIFLSGVFFVPHAVGVENVRHFRALFGLLLSVSLVASYFRPAQANVFDDPNFYRGVFGNPNALGHMSSIGAAFFVHAFIVQRRGRWKLVAGSLAALSLVLLLKSGARSSAVGFVAGFLTLYILYKRNIKNYFALGAAVLVLAVLALPALIGRAEAFLVKHTGMAEGGGSLERLSFSRKEQWLANLRGFSERPVLGWGFGVDADANLKNWNGELTSIGYAGRDPVNDLLYSMEMGGMAGLLAYMISLCMIYYAWRRVSRVAKFRRWMQDEGHVQLVDLCDAQNLFLCLTVLLAVLFQLDDTAFAAGDLFAACLWVSLGLTLGLNRELCQRLRG